MLTQFAALATLTNSDLVAIAKTKHNVRPSLYFQEWCAAVAAEST